jgi:MFS family permease
MTAAERAGLATVLRNSSYRRLFAAQTVSRWGDTANTVALVVLIYRLTGSGLGVSGVVIAEILPVLLLAPIAAAVVDRLPRVRVMVAADLLRTGLAAVLPLVDTHVAAVYAAAFGLAAGAMFFNPASASVLPSIVAEEELVAANSGLWSAAVTSQIALAPAAGALVAAWGTQPRVLVQCGDLRRLRAHPDPAASGTRHVDIVGRPRTGRPPPARP